ncbi:uncharacterized protein BT62DRAFT_420050 [Guyanagaster necrorhizus]|uniref:Uncharacterized protein n=1 Tax=Guyanagaster necrorhizus TaxID=856835 RepID=A0A9P7W2H2_9AGAR|nr:uncharacterized protein BT62DRAFT_420050 [Guyanagaster necrorhizus MCA 3950]KAG7451374.1 hypothetical protein BT62DRAFT_420050 [Guyanagaster necrorhizus MCA 3950]
MLRDAMEKYPFDRSQLQVGPIARHSFTIANFRKFLSSNPKIQSFASTDESICLQFSDPFLWCGKPGGHALLFGPCHTLQLNDIEAKWIAHPMKDMYGATRELFVVNHDTAYYDGTYKCLPLSHGMIPGGCSDLSGLDLEALARTTVSDQGASYKLYQDSFEAVVDLWKSNILKVECVGLQHVGFNEGLYNALVQMGRKLGDKESGCMKSRVEGRAKSSTKRTISEYSEKHEHPVKRRKES